MNHIRIFEKLNEQKGKALGKKMDEIDELLKPYTVILDSGVEEITIPDKETALKYEKLNKEFREIVEEIRLIDQN